MCYPLIFKLEGKKILFIGAGEVSLRKVKAILSFSKPDITVISKDFNSEFFMLPVKLIKKEAEPSDISKEYDFVFICTDDKNLNRALTLKAKELSIPVNVANDRKACDFYTPAVIRFEDVIISISTQGKNPSRSKEFKEKLLKALKCIDFEC